jgi:nucleoside 2-deoxyribosyltransferase
MVLEDASKMSTSANRLAQQRVYLAGAMDRVKDRGVTWRDSITPFLESMNIIVFNPLNKPCSIGIEDNNTHIIKKQLKEQENYDQLSSIMKTIRGVDLRLVDISDFLLVNLDLETHPCGTYEEIFLANRQKKPIIVHMEQGKQNAPDWLFGTIPHNYIFSSWSDIRTYLNYINSNQTIDNQNRWYFFNL